jgi:hypothetical protein
MKYSIRGNMLLSDGSAVVAVLNNYSLWRLITAQGDTFSFEAWVNTQDEKNALFDDLKPFVDEFGEFIDWHECTHDEPIVQPCVISETYVRE